MFNLLDRSNRPFRGQLALPPSICPMTGFLTEPTHDGPEPVRLTTIDALDRYWLHGMLDTEQAVTKLLMLVAELRQELDQLTQDVQLVQKAERLSGEEAADG